MSFNFIQLSDPQFGFGGYDEDAAAFEEAVREINTMDVEFVLICGDLTHEHACDAALAHVQQVQAKLKVPSFIVPGNHDLTNEPTPELIQRWRRKVGPDHQQIRFRGTRFVLINTQIYKHHLAGETERQRAWIEESLADARRAGEMCFVVGHVPLFTDDPQEEHKYYNLPPEARADFARLFAKYGVSAYLTGHIHRNLDVNIGGVHQVSTASTSFNYDGVLRGFRVWRVHPGGYTCRYHGLTAVPIAVREAA